MMKLSCPEQLEKIQKDLLTAIGDEDKTDLAIVCEGNVKLLAHKIVLATVSPFLKTLLKDQPLIEATTTIHFPDVTADHFRLLLEFVYKGQVALPSIDHVKGLKDLLELLHYDKVESLVEEPEPEEPEPERAQTPRGAPPKKDKEKPVEKEHSTRRRNRNRPAARQVTEERPVARRPQRNNCSTWNDRSTMQRSNNSCNNNQSYPMGLMNTGPYLCAYCNGNSMSLVDLVYHLILIHPFVTLVVRPGQPLRVSCVFCQLVMCTLPDLGNHLVAQHLGMIRANNNYY